MQLRPLRRVPATASACVPALGSAAPILAFALAPALAATTTAPALAQQEPPSEPPADWEATAIDYSNVPYPYPVEYLNVRLMGRDHRMAYMDVAPEGEPNGRTAVIFHGMNFFAGAYGPTIDALREAGFRVIAVDRLGFGRSSKPLIHYNLHMHGAPHQGAPR